MHKSIPKKEDFMFPLQLNDQIIQSLSKNELKILQYVYGHSSETCEMSIHEFSRVISYSPGDRAPLLSKSSASQACRVQVRTPHKCIQAAGSGKCRFRVQETSDLDLHGTSGHDLRDVQQHFRNLPPYLSGSPRAHLRLL